MTTVNKKCPECGPQGGRGWITLFREVVRCRTCDQPSQQGTIICYIEDRERRYTRLDGTCWGRFIEDVLFVAVEDGIEDIDEFFLGAMAARHHSMATHHATVTLDRGLNGVRFIIRLPGIPVVEGYCLTKTLD